MKTSNIIYMLILSLTFFSCKKEIDFNGEISDPKIVLNSYVSPDSVLIVHLSKSKFFLSDESGFEMIENGTVNLYINDVWKEKLQHLTEGNYSANYKPQPGEKVTIKVNVPGFDEVSSQTTIPELTNLLEITTTKVLNTSEDVLIGNEIAAQLQSYDVTFNIKLKDNVNQQNYYRIIMKRRYYDGDILMYEDFAYFNLQGYDSQGTNIFDFISGDSGNWSNIQVLTDEFFNGKEVTLKVQDGYQYFKVNSGFEDYFNGKGGSNTSFVFNIQSISKDMYLYLKTKEASQNSIGGFFSEPVVIYNNVENGIGILGAYTNMKKEINLN